MKFATTLLKVITHFDPRKLDNQGTLLILIALKKKDEEYKHNSQLKSDLKNKEVTPDDLPKDFSKKHSNLLTHSEKDH